MPTRFSGYGGGVVTGTGLIGVSELSAQLEDLKKGLDVKVMRSAVRAGIQPAFDKALRTIPVGQDLHRTYRGRLVAPGFSKRSLRIVTKVSEGGTKISAALGVRREAFYAVLFTELGTSKYPARPWLRPAMRTTQGLQQAALAAKLKQKIEAIAKKAARKTRKARK